jgi:uncharacterized membrane protein YbhN (UPF0104 family)
MQPSNSVPAEKPESLVSAFLKSGIAVLVGLGLAALAIRSTGVSVDDLWAKLSGADLPRILLGALGGFVLTATQAVRWQAVLRGVTRVRFWTVFESKLVGYAANCVLPARLGDLVRIEFMSSMTAVSRPKILATGVTDLWFDKIGWIITFGIAYFVAPMPDWVTKAMSIMGVLILGIGTVLFFLSRLPIGPVPGTLVPAPKISAWKEIVLRFREGLNQPRMGRLFVIQLFLSPLSWCWETLLIQFVGGAFGFDLNFAQAFAVLTAFNLSMVVPIPGNAGAFEVAATFALRAFGVPADEALAFSVLYHLMFLVPGIIAGTAIFGLKSGKMQLLKSIRRAYRPESVVKP